MHLSKYCLKKLKNQFKYANEYAKNFLVYKISKKMRIPMVLDVLYNIVLCVLIFSAMLVGIYFFFGSLPLYAYMAAYMAVRPKALEAYDGLVGNWIYVGTIVFCIFFELFAHFTVFRVLIKSYYKSVVQTSTLNHIGSLLFYFSCVYLGLLLSWVFVDVLGDLLDLLSIKELSGQIGLACISLCLIILVENEAKGVHRRIAKSTDRPFALILYLCMVWAVLPMLVIWFAVDFGIPLTAYLLEAARHEIKEIFA
ncbi:uncharacterized protein NEMAJ01_1488 [Nematocida major]|uniref:uncharacterized protein n=1 Tax=Nematocida major TaxID=1912982 RepID=UPI0020073313|nr:uncharacterized protein NEMAJ01_1488 [Nematocida major]KAH9386592.1 hypothetical protein NEMAJ01_1488 [Nematocida major]